MLRRLIVFAVVLAVAMLLLFLQNKVLVGEQELQAQLQAEDKIASPSDGSLRFKLVFSDLGGNGVPTTAYEREQVLTRLAGNTCNEPWWSRISAITAEHALQLTVPAGVSESEPGPTACRGCRSSARTRRAACSTSAWASTSAAASSS